MNKIILADSQAIFRAGTAKVLAMDEDVRIIAQCTDLDRMHHAITTFPGSIVLFASSLRPDMIRLPWWGWAVCLLSESKNLFCDPQPQACLR